MTYEKPILSASGHCRVKRLSVVIQTGGTVERREVSITIEKLYAIAGMAECDPLLLLLSLPALKYS